MTDHDTFEKRKLPQHKLVAYQVAIAFLAAVRDARIRDPKLNDQALRAAKSVCLNLAEGAGRVGRGDKKRAYGIARGETVEAMAAVEIAAVAGDTLPRCAGEGAFSATLLTAADEVDDFEVVALGDGGGGVLRSGDDGSVSPDGDRAGGEIEVGDQRLDGEAVGDGLILAIDPQAHQPLR